MTENGVTVRTAVESDLPQIRALWRKDSHRLGFFPDGAFQEALAKEQIIVAEYQNHFAGYTLYRLSRGRATIVHLCSMHQMRGKGIAQALNNELVDRTRALGCSGIALHCRRDYDLQDFWAHLGYLPIKEKQGRGATGKPLTLWWHDHHQPDLFNWACGLDDNLRLVIVIDTNVLIRLHGSDEDPRNEVAKALDADWLSDLVEICVTPEAFVEANRSSDESRRITTRQWIQQHRILQPDTESLGQAKSLLEEFFPLETRVSENDISDFNHAAYALAGGAEILITLDEAFLERASKIRDDIDIRIMDPAEFVLEIDQLVRENMYAPVRLGGSKIQARRIQNSDRTQLATDFQASAEGESRPQFEAKLRSFLAQPVKYEVMCYEHPDDGLLALLVRENERNHTVKVPLFRVRSHKLSPTVARHVLSKLISDGSGKDTRTFSITDDHLSKAITEALEESRFRKTGEIYTRTAYPGIHPITDVMAMVNKQEPEINSRPEASLLSPQMAMNLELSIWPGKVGDSPLPTFIVPIYSTFAMHLFDAKLADQDLFGAQTDLALACENVYYRSNQACGLTAPSRVLWYVKKEENIQGCMSIRACSLLNELHVDTPKKLYRRFRRLGVYEWRDLAVMVKNPTEDKIMAFQFSHTELFMNPIPWARFRELGINTTLQSPLKVSSSTFETIYKLGMNND